jgi:hypothetical protein
MTGLRPFARHQTHTASSAPSGTMQAVPSPAPTPRGPRTGVSACVIARDEEARLADCLASVAFCDEIVVVDSGSTDGTVAIAQAAGARVVAQPWLGFGAQRNVAIDHARGEWILEVDADERVSPALRAEIEAFLAAPPPEVALCGLPLRDVFLGKPLGPSAKYPKYRHRLFRADVHRHDEARTVHEGIVPAGPVHPFAGDLVHLVAEDLTEAVGDAWRYARLEAGQLQAPRSARGVLVGAVARPAAKLAYRVVVDGGWRDGWRGLVKIGLDAGGDALVWVRHLLRRRGAVLGQSGVPASQHFGAWRTRLGSVRVVVVAGDAAAGRRAAAWASRAWAAGDDVVLLAPGAAPGAPGPRHVALDGGGPVPVARAVATEEQLRPVDAVVAFGRRAATALRVLPPAAGQLVLDGDVLTPEAVRSRALADRHEAAA